jgi:hypothetical protein
MVAVLSASPNARQLYGQDVAAAALSRAATLTFDGGAADTSPLALPAAPQRARTPKHLETKSDVLRPGMITASYAKQKMTNLGCCEDREAAHKEKESSCAAAEEEKEEG